jgi:hypothetical protein
MLFISNTFCILARDRFTTESIANTVGYQSTTATGVARSIAGPFAQRPILWRETSRRRGLPLILMPRLLVLVLKVLEPIHVIAQHGPVALR